MKRFAAILPAVFALALLGTAGYCGGYTWYTFGGHEYALTLDNDS